jgi:hypothetical protein
MSLVTVEYYMVGSTGLFNQFIEKDGTGAMLHRAAEICGMLSLAS